MRGYDKVHSRVQCKRLYLRESHTLFDFSLKVRLYAQPL